MSALTDTFTAIANAIRGKLGVQTTYTPTQMSSAIASIPTEKPEQTKSVTATTSAQTVTPDTGKVLSSVTVNPQVHSATYTPTGYSNANDMGAQNNYRYVDTSAYEPTSITPSNSSPVAMSANTGYKPTESGYAISSYNGLVPSDSSPVPLAGRQIYKITNGTATQVQGYAIESNPASKTPSDTSPASVSSGQIVKAGSAGYLVKTVSKIGEKPDKVYTSDSNGTSGNTTITVTKKPRYAFVSAVGTGNSNYFYMYMFDFTKSKAWRFTRAGTSTIVSEDWSSNISVVFPTVSSSQVVFANNCLNMTKRLFIALYY